MKTIITINPSPVSYHNFSEYAATVKVGKEKAVYDEDKEFIINDRDRKILFQLEENAKAFDETGKSEFADRVKECFKYLYERTMKT